MLSVNQDSFLSLVRLGIGYNSIPPKVADWLTIKSLADKQGLTAIIVDAIEQLPDTKRPPKELLLQWIGEVFQSYENRYKLYQRAIAELAGWYNTHGYKMMVLKGYACSIDWPKSEHRPCGDIDIWLFGKQREADTLLSKEKSIGIDKGHHHHTVFEWKSFPVENHYDFVNVHAHKSSAEIENVFKELGGDDTNTVNVCDEKVYLPSPNLHALFLVKHNLSHFAAANITLRQVLDWAFFVEKHTDEIDWDWLKEILGEYHMRAFFDAINAICVENLGFESDIFKGVQFNPELKEKVLSDILEPKFEAKEIKYFIPRWWYRMRRWRGNAWKQKLCYNESRWENFWSGLLAHIKKPISEA